MTRLTLDLGDDLTARLRERAAETGHASVEEYVQALLRSEAETSGTDDDFGAPATQTAAADADLVSKLDEGLASGPATEMTAGDWQDVRREVEERVAALRRTSGK